MATHQNYHGVPEPIKLSAGIVVQFVNGHDGAPIAPAVNLLANVARESLEVLVNQLRTKVSSQICMSMHIPMSPPASLEADILNHPSHAFTEEDIIIVPCAPQSVFKVRPATRCSCTLSGHSSPILFGLWDLNTETPSHTLVGYTGWVLCVEWDPVERKLASGGHYGHVRLWDPKTGKPTSEAIKGHSKVINVSAPRLASSSKDGTVRVWSTATRRLQYALGGYTTRGGKGISYTESSDRTVRVWDAQFVNLIVILQAEFTDRARTLGHYLALNTDLVLRTGPFDHIAKRPASASDEEAQGFALKRYDAIISRTPKLLISGSNDHTHFLWLLFSSLPEAGGGKTKPINRLTGQQRQVSHVALSRDGRWAERNLGNFVATLRGHVSRTISASKYATLKVRLIYETLTYKLKNDLPGHVDEMYCVGFVADKVVSVVRSP
ncbi:WD40 repeat-like protein [Gyrodon lividus]|nr:WD40 repeat-like protein [Gyrodon lividus]